MLSGLVSSLVDATSNFIGGQLDYSRSKKMATTANRRQWEFWQANNDYNSPKSQMQRLEEAGLNPNLVYGNGAATHQATMATAQSARPTKSGLGGFLERAYQMENMNAQNDNLKQQNFNLFEEGQLLGYDKDLKAKQIVHQERVNDLMMPAVQMARMASDFIRRNPRLAFYGSKGIELLKDAIGMGTQVAGALPRRSVSTVTNSRGRVVRQTDTHSGY